MDSDEDTEFLEMPELNKYIGLEPTKMSYWDITDIMRSLWEIFPRTIMTLHLSSPNISGAEKGMFTMLGVNNKAGQQVLTLGIPYVSKDGPKVVRAYIVHSELSIADMEQKIRDSGRVSTKTSSERRSSRPLFDLEEDIKPSKPTTDAISAGNKDSSRPVVAIDQETLDAIQSKADATTGDATEVESVNPDPDSYSSQVNKALEDRGVVAHPFKKSEIPVLLRQLDHHYPGNAAKRAMHGLYLTVTAFAGQVERYLLKEDPNWMLTYGVGYSLVALGFATWEGKSIHAPQSIRVYTRKPV